MLLTLTEKERIKTYCIGQMLENKLTICSLLDDTENIYTFLEALDTLEYKRAFDLCCAVFEVYTKEAFIQNVIDYIYPELRKKQAEYNIFIHSVLSNDYEYSDKLCMYYHDQLETLSNIIFD